MERVPDLKTSTDLIPTESFVQRMEGHWTHTLGNVTSEALRQTWKQLAEAFNFNITPHSTPELAYRWIVAQPAAGTGKTQGAIVYCSMLTKEEHPGALIVTRLIEDADNIARQINELSGQQVAIAHHSESESKLIDLKEWPVLVITHRAYEIALDFLGQDGTIQQTWPFFHEWNGQRRKLVIIDECLDLVEHSQVDLERLRGTIGIIPQSIRNTFSKEIASMETMLQIMGEMDRISQGKRAVENMLLTKAVTQGVPPDFNSLRSSLRSVRFDKMIGRDDLRENERLRKRHDKVIRSLQYVFRSWLYYAKVNAKHTLNTARLLLPEEVKGAVVLDATASANLVYQLFENAWLLTPPQGARDYQNVTLHVSKGHRLGKVFMGGNAPRLAKNLIGHLNEVLPGRNVFLITHKSVEPVLLAFSTTFNLKTGHWGKVDGSNQWKDCDSCVVFGLPFRPDWWTANVFMAYQGPQEDEWFQAPDRPFNGHQDIRQALKLGQIITEVVQAVNRVRCRKVIDQEGNCPKTDVYLMLPDRIAEEILHGIKGEMPGVKVKDWPFGEQKVKKRVRKSNTEAALICYLQDIPEGKQSKSHIQRVLGLSTTSMDRLLEKARQGDTDLSAKMIEARVKLDVIREGTTQKTYFVKD